MLGLILLPYITASKLLGITLGKLSIKPPPVICAHALMWPNLCSLSIELTYILVGVNKWWPIDSSGKSLILSFILILLFFKTFLTNEKPFEWTPELLSPII